MNVRKRSLLVSLLTAAVAAFGGSGLTAAAGPESPLYVKKATWTETVAATRANLEQFRREEAKQSGAADVRPPIRRVVRGDAPAQHLSINVEGCRWLRLATVLEQAAGNCHIWGEAKLVAEDGAVTKLSSLTPASIKVGWGELLKDLNWQDHVLQIGEKKFAHGIWVHANSDVCYLLEGKYDRFETWVGIDIDRPQGAARFEVHFDQADPLPGIWKNLLADFPLQSSWLTLDAGRGQELQWLLEKPESKQVESLVRQVLGPLGACAEPLRGQLGGLRRAATSDDDPRWLDLYARACRVRQCRNLLDRIWIAELQRKVESQLTDLLDPQVPPDDARWGELCSTADRTAKALPPGRRTDVSSMQGSIGILAKTFSRRFQGEDRLRAQVKSHQRRWRDVIDAAARGEDQAIAQLPALAQDLLGIRRGLLLSLEGMSQLLAAPSHAAMETEWECQFQVLQDDLGNRQHFTTVAPETYREEALIFESDRDPADIVLRRTAALLNDLQRTSAASRLVNLTAELAELQSANEVMDVDAVEARYVLFAEACRLRRRIAFLNPLLNFDEILFIKRHRALFNHMCDQYYGMAAAPGGGLYVLSDAFGADPQVRDVLADSVVQRGRLKGHKLWGGPNAPPPWKFDGQGNLQGPDHEGGSFLSPDLSFDGKTILFAYVECTGDKLHKHHTDPARGHWDEGRCYHVFKVNVDGSELQQLTDGAWNDFDPCWLPNGRIAFISERRGGYLRCGRVCPTYTLYDMNADGGDIICLSFHETNEWHPSVTNDGMILWTRWDYVDRHGCTAHMPWLTTLDGRNPRAVHGNFAPRPSRPDMELDCRAIPGSHKLTATAAPHHGQAYGSLVLIDPHVPDDDGMAPVKRITPEVGFPESQGGAQVYGTAWPLNEDYYVCVYDAAMRPGDGRQGGQQLRGNYGIYLVDSFGNRELIYRDPEIACLSPIPLRPRPMPLWTPELAGVRPGSNPSDGRRTQDASQHAEATVAVINVYDSLKPWPPNTRIKELRVLQVLPMSVPSGRPPHETGVRMASAGDSVVPVRYVLGSAPVEEDGSAHFTVPANKELFFQALDDAGLAVQSMRSATHLREGEHLVCAGCHEPKHRTTAATVDLPIALRRPASRLKPDVDGSNPFSYPRLVQPVLDRRCFQCHNEHRDTAPNLGREPIERNWYASYNSLVKDYGFYDYGDGYRTTPGRFGARASKLYQLLQDGHYDVKLSHEELRRLTLWLDCSSMFYGVYEQEGGQAQLRGDVAFPTLE